MKKAIFLLSTFYFLLSTRLSFAAVPQASIQISPLILEYTLLPGQSQRDLIVFFNPSSVTQIVTPKVYDFTADDEVGGLKFFEDSGWQFSASKWILFEKEPFELLPKEERALPVAILVPEEAESGSHYAAVFGEAESTQEEETDDQVRVRVHVGAGTLFLINVPDTLGKGDFYSGHLVSFQIHGLKEHRLAYLPARSSLSLPSTGPEGSLRPSNGRAHPSLFDSAQSALSDNRRAESKTGKAGILSRLTQRIQMPVGVVGDRPLTFIVRFKNTGNFHQRPEGKIEIFNLLGKKTDEVLLKKQRVLPGAIIQFKASWKPKFLFGSYLAKLRFSYGKENNLTTESDLKFAVFSPLLLALPLGAVLLVSGILFYRKRRSSSKNSRVILDRE